MCIIQYCMYLQIVVQRYNFAVISTIKIQIYGKENRKSASVLHSFGTR